MEVLSAKLPRAAATASPPFIPQDAAGLGPHGQRPLSDECFCQLLRVLVRRPNLRQYSAPTTGEPQVTLPVDLSTSLAVEHRYGADLVWGEARDESFAAM